ncbi:helix-turn-helix domain-containing protein [Empedobacter falsenii]
MSVISYIYCVFEYNNGHFIKKQVLLPKYKNGLSQMGENIKLARKRRKLTAIQVAERAGISRSTLYLI